MMLLVALVLCIAGFAGLALSMRKHHRDILGGPPDDGRRLVLRLLGWGLLALALWPSVAAWGLSVGIVAWTGLLSIAALVVVLALTYWPRKSMR